MEKFISALSLSKKAGALVLGFDAVKTAVTSHRTFIVFFTQDFSEGSKKRIKRMCENIVRVEELPCKKEDLLYITRKETGVFAVCDENLAALCLKHLQNTL